MERLLRFIELMGLEVGERPIHSVWAARQPHRTARQTEIVVTFPDSRVILSGMV